MKKDLSVLPIGVIDSGIGGLVVLKELTIKFPSESFIYLGDNGNNPYGNKSLKEVERLTCNLIDKLLNVGVKAVVIGCNTVSTNLYTALQKRYKTLLIPTLPPKDVTDNTFIMCTELTAKSEYVKRIYKDRILSFPTLAKEIEISINSLKNLNVKKLLNNLPKSCEKLVLGCTHYSFIENNIKNEFNLEIITPYDSVCDHLKLLLRQNKLLTTKTARNIDFIGDFALFNKDIYYNVLVKGGR